MHESDRVPERPPAGSGHEPGDVLADGEPTGSGAVGWRGEDIVFRPVGLWASLPFARRRRAVRIDHGAGVIARGAVEIPFAAIRRLEVRAGVFGVSDGERWICFDTLRHADAAGVLGRRDGSLSPSFSKAFYELQQAAARSAREAEGRAPPPVPREAFDFRYRLRIDLGNIVFTLIGLALFFGFYGQQLLDGLRTDVLWQCIAALGLFVVGLFTWRRASRVRFDDAGIHLTRGWWTRSYPWSEMRGRRQQALELELEGDRRRLSFNLDLLHGLGSPLLVRRGARPFLTPLGAGFLDWLRARTTERPEVSIFGTTRERLVGRIWVLVVFVANSMMFYLSIPPPSGRGERADQVAFMQRLVELGARTPDSFDQPWRFFTALFLHGDILHFGVNMLFLAIVAPWLGRIFGWPRTTALYFGSGVLGNALAQLGPFFSSPEKAPPLSIGASTALLGILGSLLAAIYRRPLSVPLAARARFRWAIPLVLLMTLGLGLSVKFIDNDAHVGGFVAGFVLAWIIPPRKPRT